MKGIVTFGDFTPIYRGYINREMAGKGYTTKNARKVVKIQKEITKRRLIDSILANTVEVQGHWVHNGQFVTDMRIALFGSGKWKKVCKTINCVSPEHYTKVG